MSTSLASLSTRVTVTRARCAVATLRVAMATHNSLVHNQSAQFYHIRNSFSISVLLITYVVRLVVYNCDRVKRLI